MIRKCHDVKGGIACRRCGCNDLRVVYTRRLCPGWITRRRECRHCGRRLTTREREVPPPA